MKLGAAAAVDADLEPVREPRDQREAHAEAGAVGAGRDPDADIADDDDEFAVRAVDLDRQRAGRRSVAIGVHDDVRARLRDGEPDVVAQSRGESEGFGRLEDRPPDDPDLTCSRWNLDANVAALRHRASSDL